MPIRPLLILPLLLAVCAVAAFGQSVAKVGQQTLTIDDATRGRKLITEVWYPTADDYQPDDLNLPIPFKRVNTVRGGRIVKGKLPLIMLSHGFGGGRLTVEWLSAALAQKGYMVAAVDHFGNTFDNLIPEKSIEFYERPKDISFVVTELLKNPNLKNSIDEKRIGAVGYSLGGYTVIALAGGELDSKALFDYFGTERGRKEMAVPELPASTDLTLPPSAVEYFKKQSPALKDNRIKAVFALAPGLGQGFTRAKQFRKVNVPVYIVAAEDDRIAPLATNADHFRELIKNSQYLLLKGKVSHYIFLNEANEELSKQMPLFFADDQTVKRSEIHRQVAEVAASYFKKELK